MATGLRFSGLSSATIAARSTPWVEAGGQVHERAIRALAVSPPIASAISRAPASGTSAWARGADVQDRGLRNGCAGCGQVLLLQPAAGCSTWRSETTPGWLSVRKCTSRCPRAQGSSLAALLRSAMRPEHPRPQEDARNADDPTDWSPTAGPPRSSWVPSASVLALRFAKARYRVGRRWIRRHRPAGGVPSRCALAAAGWWAFVVPGELLGTHGRDLVRAVHVGPAW